MSLEAGHETINKSWKWQSAIWSI